MNKYLVTVNGDTHEVKLISKENSRLTFEIEGEIYESSVQTTIDLSLAKNSTGIQKIATSSKQISNVSDQNSNNILAPMPGIIVSISAKEGDEVNVGDTVLVMEAMKMENNITSSKKAKIKKIHVKAGEEVSNNQLLVEFV